MEQYKTFNTGDWELTKERLQVVEPIVSAMHDYFHANDFDLFVFEGDLFAEGGFCPETVRFVNKWIPKFTAKKASPISGPGTFLVPPVLLLGNHDWLIGEDKISALFAEGDLATVITRPQVLRMSRPWSKTSSWTPTLAILPAPDRARLGSFTGPQGPRERDAEISRLLEAALIDLEMEAGDDQEKALLLFHGTVNSTYFNGSKLSSGLTWTVDSTRLQGWGAAVGGHIHSPVAPDTGQGTHIVYTGTIAPDRHGMKAQRFRAVAATLYENERPSLANITLPRGVVPIELTIDAEGIRKPDGDHVELIHDWVGDPASAVLDYLVRVAGVDPKIDLVDLKLRLQLPRFQLNEWPDGETVKRSINEDVQRPMIYKIQIKKEETNTDKIRLEHLDENTALVLDELVVEWAKASGLEDHPRLAQALGLLTGTEFSDWKSEGHKGVVPIKTVVKNFRQWNDVTIDWTSLKGAVAVIGDNATGKTNLAEAPLFAWYKKTPSTGGTLKSELKIGEKKGFVEHTWSVDGKTYLVRRALERAGNGEVSCKSELFELYNSGLPVGSGGEWVPGEGPVEKHPVCEKAIDIDKKIVEINGASFDFMISTLYGTQGQVDNLINATPTTWHKLIIESLGLDRFEIFRVACTRARDEIEKTLQKQTAKIEELDEQIATKQGELSDIDVEALTLTVAEKKSKIREEEAVLASLEEKRAQVDETRATVRAKLQELAKIADKLGVQKTRVAEAKKNWDETLDIGERPEIPVNAEAKIATGEGLIKRNNELAEQMDKQIDGGNEITKKMNTAIATADAEINVWITDLANKNKRLDELAAKEGGLELPPCTESVYTDDHGPGFFSDRCPAWSAFSSGARIKELTIEIGELEKKIQIAKDDKARVESNRDDHVAQVKTIQDKRAVVAEQSRDIEKTVGDLKNLQKAVQLWDAKHESQKTLQVTYTQAAAEESQLEKELEDLDKYEARRDELTIERNELDQRIPKTKKDIAALQEELQAAEKSINQATLIGELIEDNAKKISTYKAEIGDWGTTAEAWGLLEKAFHHTGLPFLLLERMIPVFEATANELLAGTDLAIHFHTQREVGEGKERHFKDEIHVDHTGPRGTLPLKSASNAEKRTLGLAARFTMAKVGAEFWGRVPMFFIQDEGFGAFHSTRLGIALDLIKKVAAVYQTFLFITHVVPLSEGADQVLLVEVLADGSSQLTY